MENLKNQGWILSETFLKSIETSGSSKNLAKTLLDRDLREIGAGINDLHKGKFDNLDHELAVLQILKIRNISAPKANESSKTAPKMLKLQLTDGVNSYSAIEMESTALSIDTKPGSKIALKVKNLKMTNGQLLLTPNNIEILGGYVEALVTKWELTRSLAGMKGARTNAAGGPPPFIPFGQKISQTNLPSDQRGFKSLQPAKPKESENDDSEFKAQRQDAIAEASKAGTKKTFGGGSKTLVDSNVQKIIDKGYSEEQATTALKYSRNNVEKALIIIKRKEDQRQRASSNDYEPREYSKEKRGKERQSESTAAKPSGAVSLFAFLEDKIPTTQPESTAKQFENNMSSSFRKHDKDFSNNNSQHWSQHSSNFSEQKSSHNYKGSNNYNAREYRDGGREQPRDYRNNRDSRDSRDTRDSRDNRDGDLRRDGDFKRDSKYHQSNNSYQSKPNSSATNQYQRPSSSVNNGGNNNFNSSSVAKGKYQKPDLVNKPGLQQKDYNNFSSSTGNGKYDASKFRGNHSSSKYSNEHQSYDHQKSTRNVVDSMEKMSIKGNNQAYKGGDTRLNNYPPLTPLAVTEAPKQKSFSQPGYPPIVGFQNKEANENAKNALKTKNIPGAPHQQHQKPSNWQQQPPTSSKQHSMPPNVNSQQMKTQPPPPFPASPGVVQSAPTPMHTLPQPFVQHQGHSMIHTMPGAAVIAGNPPPPAVFHQTINFPTPIMMQTVPPPPGIVQPVGNMQQLKSGDLCLAKYWEDGQFYQAKITAVGESTFVVLFPEYGNAEEVRKTDCLPIIPTSQHPASFVSAPQMNASYQIPAQKMPHHNNYHHQQAPTNSMPYKGGPVKNLRRN